MMIRRMSWRRQVNRFAWCVLAFSLTLCAGISVAYASTANWVYGTFNFQGNSCSSMLAGAEGSRIAAEGLTTDRGRWLACDTQTMVSGITVIGYFAHTNGNTYTNPFQITAVDVASVSPTSPATVNVDFTVIQTMLVGLGLVLCFAAGLNAGLLT